MSEELKTWDDWAGENAQEAVRQALGVVDKIAPLSDAAMAEFQPIMSQLVEAGRQKWLDLTNKGHDFGTAAILAVQDIFRQAILGAGCLSDKHGGKKLKDIMEALQTTHEQDLRQAIRDCDPYRELRKSDEQKKA